MRQILPRKSGLLGVSGHFVRLAFIGQRCRIIVDPTDQASAALPGKGDKEKKKTEKT